ncbi:oxidoreductase nitrogenase component 1 [Clostridium polyendosporum]|uniref:Oxidoreductase nitrogenase component 1 n=1 Tax=Clostridium polyendosporum TaxID=69208 RepID=A0A919VF15_9CLOT|nr:nitrogenase component 1 [Clostridium polyendosporum]GIM29774.1 oxidoreductase nitrogenase component 1 [Clostridium polyendosporum]
MSLLARKKPQIRENRLNTLGAYLGDSDSLLNDIEKNDVKQRIRTFSQTSFDDIIYVLQAINSIKDSVVIVHGPVGCSAAQLHFFSQGESSPWIVTNLNQKDSIMGGDEKLRKAVFTAYNRHKPKVIFIVATPVVAINNDDIQAVVIELKEELGVDIIPIYSDGFKSKNSITGYDLALHALVKYLVAEEENHEKLDFVNLISISENAEDLKEIVGLLNNIGVKVNLLSRFASPESIKSASKAKLSININKDYGDYLGKALYERYNIPFIETSLPIGIKGTTEWLTEIASVTGTKKETEDFVNKAVSQLRAYIEKNKLNDVKVYVNLPTSLAFGVIELIKEFEGEVVGVTVGHIDDLHKKELENISKNKTDFKIHVANGQTFEEVNIVRKLKPDLYIGGLGQTAWIAKLGIPVVSVDSTGILGYSGITKFIHQINKALKNKAFVRYLGKATSSIYEESWIKKSANWYIKQEVK